MAADDRWIKSLSSKIKVVTNFKLSDLIPTTSNQPVIQASITDVTSTTARLNWVVQTPGVSITGWDNGRDNVDAGGGGVYQVVDGASSSSRLFINLVPERTYNLNVQAVTASGRSNKITLPVTLPANSTTTPTFAPATPVVKTTNGATNLYQAGGKQLKIAGACVWGFNDYITGEFGTRQYNARATTVNTIKSWGGNLVRLRFLISDYNKGNKAEYIAQIKAWRDVVLAADMYLCVTFWDSLDGDYQDAGWATQYSNAFAGMKDIVSALGTDSRIIYEPWNEPNNVSGDQWLTAMRATISYYRNIIGYKGVLFINSYIWSHQYDDTRWSNLEAFDTELLGGQHQLVFCRHDYANEYTNKAWSATKWLEENGGTATKHAILESEFGNYNGDPSTVNETWSANASTFFAQRTAANYVGAIPFLYGPWYDANAMTTSDFMTPTAWGNIAKNNFFAQAGGVRPSAAETTTAVTNPSSFAFPNSDVTNQFGAWKLNYATNFDTDAAMGTFHSTSAYANRFDNYDGYKDTTKFGTYDSTKTTFVSDGKLQVRMRTINGVPYVSAPIVRTVAGQGFSGQTYGRYSVAMRSVSEALNDGSYKVAFMLWPTDDVWPQHGEYDFPESGLKSGYTGDAAHHRAFTNNVVDKFLSTASIRDWHVYTIEWTPTVVRYLVDGAVIGSAANGVYNGNMRWTLQCETEISSNPPSAGSVERVEIDWLAQWSYTAP